MFFPSFLEKEVTWWGSLEIKLSEEVLLTTTKICLLKGATLMDRAYWRATLGSQVWPVGGILKRGFIWTRRCLKAAGYWAPNWPHSQTLLLPYRVTLLCDKCGPSLLLLSFSQPCSSFSFGGKGLWKEVKYLGWSFDGAGNRTLDHWPPTPGLKMRPPSRILGCP